MTLRKDFLCGERCGCPCRGRCTIEAAERVLAWTAKWAALGENPPCRHDGMPFMDERRRAAAGQPLTTCTRKVRFALIEYRADWDQISGGLGMQRPSQEHFCFKCQCCKPDRYKFDAADSWIPRTHANYLADVDRSQLVVKLGMDDLRVLFANFVLDARDNGVHGRALARDLQIHDWGTGALVQLKKWDRLEVGGDVTDIHNVPGELVGDGPWHIVLWRRIPGVHFNFFACIMQVPGMRFDYIMLDTLHFLDLGVSQRLIRHVVNAVLKDGIKFGNDGTEVGAKKGMLALSCELRQWYCQRQRQLRIKGKHSISTVGKVTLKMLSFTAMYKTGHFKAKGSECKHLMPFMLKLLQPDVVASLGRSGVMLNKAVRCLCKAFDLMQEGQRGVDVVRMHKLLMLVAKASVRARVPLIPPNFTFSPTLGSVQA